MKNLFKSILFIAAAAMTFSACNRTEIENPQNEEDFYYTFALTSPETRSILSSDENGKFGAWEDGDRLGTGIDEAKPGYAYVKVGTPATFRIYKEGGLAGGEIIYAYYPYSSSATSAAEIPMTIPSGQNQVGATFDFDAMPMVAEGFTVPASYASGNNNTEIGEISLVNLGSVVDFQVFSSNETYAEETILSVKFVASGAIAGEFTKDITAVKFNDESTFAVSGITEKEVITTVANAPAMGATRAAAAHVYMVVAPASDITGSVIVTTNKAVYTYNMSSAQTFKRAGLKSFGLNLGTCQNREAEDTDATTFVFDTTAGIESLGIELPSTGNGTNVERAVSGFIVLTGDKGTNESYYPRVWNSNGTYNFRVNRNNTITLSITNGTIKGIAFDAGDKFNLTVEEGTLTGTNWEGSASSVTFTNNDNDRTDINKITVSYSGGVAPVDPIKLVMSDIICDNPEENETSLSFSWAAVENAEGYQVSLDGGNSYGDTQSAPSYVWNDLLAGTEYTIYVKAIGDGTNFITSEAKWQKGKTKDGEIIGVQWVETALANLSSSDVVVIVGNGYAMTNDKGTGNPPLVSKVTVSGNKLVGDIADNIKWNVSASNGSCTIYPNGSTSTWLYCNTQATSGSNSNMRVGTGDRKVFVLNASNQLETNDTFTKRYLCIYNNQDWRGYINTTTANTVCPAIKFYKKVGNEPTPTTYSVTIATGIQNGSVTPSKTAGIAENESITLTISADSGYELETLTVDGKDVTSSVSNDKYTFSMPAHDVAVSASFKSASVNPGETTVVVTMSEQTASDGVISFTEKGLTFTFSKRTGSTNPTWNSRSSELRLYAKGSLSVSGKTITRIVYTYVENASNSGKLPTIESVTGATNAGTWDADSYTWSDSTGDNNVTMSLGGDAGNFGFTKITVTYK
jgi:hypothetical protein